MKIIKNIKYKLNQITIFL